MVWGNFPSEQLLFTWIWAEIYSVLHVLSVMVLDALPLFVKRFQKNLYCHHVLCHSYIFFLVTYLRLFAMNMRDLVCHLQSHNQVSTRFVEVIAYSILEWSISLTIPKCIKSKWKKTNSFGHWIRFVFLQPNKTWDIWWKRFWQTHLIGLKLVQSI